MGPSRRGCRATGVLATVVCCAGLAASPAPAAILTVNTTADTDTPDNGICSLREAIDAVNHAPTGSDCGAATAGANTIMLAASTTPYGLTIPTVAPDDNSTGDLDLAAPGPVTIAGAGSGTTTISAAALGNRILHVISGTVTIEDLTLTGGHGPNGADGVDGFVDGHGISHDPVPPGDGFNGGAIFNGGALTLDHVTVTDNFAGNGGKGGNGETLVDGTSGGKGGAGGGVYNVGQLRLTDVTMSGNHAGDGGNGGNGGAGGQGGGGGAGGCCGDGGALFSAGGGSSATIDGSTFTGNSAGNGGNGGNGGDAAGGPTSGPGNGGRGAGGFPGGAIALEGGSMILRDSTITGNLGGNGGNGGNPGSGGGDGMTAPPHGSGGNAGNGSAGGGIFVSSTATASLISVTIAANTPEAPGTPGPSGGQGGSKGSPGSPALAGGIDQSGSSTVALADTLLSLSQFGNCHGTIGNTGGNLSFGDGTCPSTFAGGDPKLVALADNGGPTETMDLGSGSAAIDAGGTLCRPTDQRGLPRPSGAACDIGAYEVTPPAVTSLASTAVTSHGATLTASVTPNARGATAVHFDVGTTTAYGSRASVPSVSGFAASPVTAMIAGLNPKTLYHYRVVATSGDGTSMSADRTFTTSAGPPPATPKLGRITVKPRTFHTTPGRHHQKTGTKLSYTDSEAATTTFAVFRLLPGVRHHGKCVKAGRHVHGGKCTRQIAAGRFSHHDAAGANTFTFGGRIGKHKLAKGHYLVRATPKAGAATGHPVTFMFTID